MELEAGDIVLCTVDRIVGTIVFVKIEGSNKEGSIITSEIAPGRIRNLREYVVPKKKIVCKILRISRNGNIDLSLRRVTQKEKKEIMEQYQQEKSYISVLKNFLKDKAEKIIEEITRKKSIFEFIEEAKENPKEFEKLAGKENAKKILDILKIQKQKKVVIKREIFLKTKKPNGLELIKKILGEIKKAETRYISAGRYVLKVESDEPKTADHELKEIIKKIEEEAKKQGMDFEAKEK